MRHRNRDKTIREKILHDRGVGNICSDDQLTSLPGIQGYRGVGNGRIGKIRISKTSRGCEHRVRNTCNYDVLNLLLQVAALRHRHKVLLRQNQLQVDACGKWSLLEKLNSKIGRASCRER